IFSDLSIRGLPNPRAAVVLALFEGTHLDRTSEGKTMKQPKLTTRYRYLLKTVTAISRLPSLRHYVIGITSSIPGRRAAYRGVGMPYFVVLATGFTAKTALDLEEALQAACYKHKIARRKYDPRKRDRRYRKSANSKTRPHAIYMAWW